jgi:hypothetical protein
MFSPLELMYFMAAGHESNKRKERENKVTTYALQGGRVAAYGLDDEIPEDAKTFATKIGGKIVNHPESPEVKPFEIDIFSRGAEYLPETEAFANDDVGATSREGWSQYFVMSGLPINSPEHADAMTGLKRVGRGDRMPNGSIENVQFMPAYYKGLVEDDTKPTAPVQIKPSRPFARILVQGETDGDFFYDERGGMNTLKKRVKSLQDNNVDFDILTGSAKPMMFGDEERTQYIFSNEVNNQLMTALGVKAASESTGAFASAPLTWTVDGKEQTFIPSSKSTDEYERSMDRFIRNKVGEGFDWTTMNAGSLDTVYNHMYNDILQKESRKAGILDPQGGLMLQPELLMSVSQYAYPTYFKVGDRFDAKDNTAQGNSFYRYFYSRARNMAADEVVRLGKAMGAEEGSPVFNASFVVDLDNGTAVGVPQFITEPKHKDAFTALLQWSANSGFSENAARSRVGNAVRSYPSVFGNPASPLAAAPSQYGLRNLAQLSTNPSSNSIAGNVLRNATLAYDPAVPGYEANAKELEQVATVVMGASPQAKLLANGKVVNESVHPTFNDKLALVSVFSPQLEDRSADLDTFYRVNDFKNKTFKGKRFDDMQSEEAAIARSSLEASRLLTEAMSQIFIINKGEDGLTTIERTPFGQRAGEALLTLSSFMENVKAGIRVGLGTVGIDEDNPVISGALSLFSSTEKVVTAIDAGSPDVGTMVQDQFGKFGRATSSFYNQGQSQETFQAKEADARKKRISDLAAIQRDMISTNSITANAARRRYLNYVIAYSVASALQGGTGGRTISDQDVQNVLNFLNGGMSTPENEFAVMSLLRDDLMYRAQRGAALSNKNNQVVLNAMILTDLETKSQFSVEDNLRNRIEFVNGENVSTMNPDDDAPAGPRIPEAQHKEFLNRVNLFLQNDDLKDDDGSILSFSSYDDFIASDKIPPAMKNQLMILHESRVKDR